jgi:ankyrin repeat protein
MDFFAKNFRDELVHEVNRLDLTLLHVAAEIGNSDIVEFLIERGADTNARDFNGFTPLIIACINRNEDAFWCLIDKTTEIEACSGQGTRAIHRASRCGAANFVRALIKRGADVNAKTVIGWTPLHYAMCYANIAVVSALLAGGADHTLTNDLGWTPLEYQPGYAYLIAEGAPNGLKMVLGDEAAEAGLR